ncbi:MAG: alpha/beta hydrolase family protein [bacterium]
MIPKEYSCLEYWRKRYYSTPLKMEFNAKTKKAFNQWQKKFRIRFLECLGKVPREKSKLEIKVLGSVETQAFVRKKIVYNADLGAKIPAYLFIPKNADFPVPAVICPHGHGRGKDDAAGVTNTKGDGEWVAKYNYDYAGQFAKRGYVTLAPDLRCFGERVDDPEKVYGMVKSEEGDHWCDINFVMGMLIGYNLLTLHIYDIGRGLDVLLSLDEVDENRIGCAGLSQGGTTALFSTAYDDRIKVACVSGYISLWKEFAIEPGGLCGSQILPGLLEYGDIPEVCGLICPRPLFIESGIDDEIFPIDVTRRAVRRVRKIYKAAGVPGKLKVQMFEGGHMFKGDKVFGFFEKWL